MRVFHSGFKGKKERRYIEKQKDLANTQIKIQEMKRQVLSGVLHLDQAAIVALKAALEAAISNAKMYERALKKMLPEVEAERAGK